MSVVLYEVRDRVARITFNRPDAANAITMEVATALREAVARAAADDDVRSVLLAGNGPRFCGGGDVASFAAAEDREAFMYALAVETDAAVRAIEQLAKPVVVAVQGAVAGVGLGFMLAADIAVAASGTKFVFAYPGIGVTPDCGVSYLLPRAIGQQRALHFALTNRPVSAQTALEWGLIGEVVHDGDVASSRATQIALDWAQGPAHAFGQARRLLRSGWEQTREEVGLDEARTISQISVTPETDALIAKFVNR